MEFIVFSENETNEAVILIYDRELVELVVLDDVVGFFEGSSLSCHDELFERCHELGDLCLRIHTGYTVVTGGNDTEKLSVGLTVLGNRECTVVRSLSKFDDLFHGVVRGKVTVRNNDSGFILLYFPDHLTLGFDRLRLENKGHTAGTRECYCHTVI